MSSLHFAKPIHLMLLDALQPFTTLWSHICTLFLFTKSDFKTSVIPMSFSALALAPDLQTSSILEGTFWIWIHILQFSVSNQIVGVEEDKENKPWRPLPAGRITLKSARRLWSLLVPICWSYSLWYGMKTFYASVAFVIATILHNDLEAHGHWLLRNVLSAVGLGAIEIGAAIIMCSAAYDRRHLDHIALNAVCISAAIITTTMHSQDFKDVIGDEKIGRATLPIIAPTFARYSIIWGLTIWSMTLAYVWDLNSRFAVAFLALGIFTGYRHVSLRSVKDDQISYYWYNVWLSIAHFLPYYYRYM
ncbi:hypothetical protein K474DRAFT_1707524 [Panus rudis PR-1116 ss-1]|nr:hypothetical protein K474DRAFT_1707524 [Panus rudis PR-1116 ss-1]